MMSLFIHHNFLTSLSSVHQVNIENKWNWYDVDFKCAQNTDSINFKDLKVIIIIKTYCGI